MEAFLYGKPRDICGCWPQAPSIGETGEQKSSHRNANWPLPKDKATLLPTVFHTYLYTRIRVNEVLHLWPLSDPLANRDTRRVGVALLPRSTRDGCRKCSCAY